MAIEALIALKWIKIILIVIAFIFHVHIGKYIKAVLLAVLLYIAIPSLDDMLWMPIVATMIGIPLLLFAIIVYVSAWILLWVVFRYVHI